MWLLDKCREEKIGGEAGMMAIAIRVGIAMCHIADDVEQRRESVHGTTRTLRGVEGSRSEVHRIADVQA